MLHQMFHARCNHPATALIASFAPCVFWFHSLAWFLKHRLAFLAEAACDEFALGYARTPECYAEILTAFALDVSNWRGRILETASSVVHTSNIEARIERIFEASQVRHKGASALRSLVIAALLPAVYLATGRINEPQAQSGSAMAAPLTTEQAQQLEAQLATKPNDLSLHRKLLVYYMNERQGPNYICQLLWTIQNHPEIQFGGISLVTPMGGPFNTPEEYSRIAAAWEQALSQNTGSADVLFNAGIFFQRTDPQRSLDLLQQAKQLDSSAKSEQYVIWIANVYAAALTADYPEVRLNGINLGSELAAKLRNDLENSTNPALLSQVGTQLVRLVSSSGYTNDAIKEKGFELLQRALDLDPANPKWKEALESSKWEPIRQQNIQEMTRQTVPSGAVRIGGKIAQANLIESVDPQYPPLALAARVQGTVEFTVTIGADGHVQNVQLVRGHPLLVQAAASALQKWIYRPTLLNGQPVVVVTDVAIPFRLPQ